MFTNKAQERVGAYVRLPAELWKAAKIYCLEHDIDAQDLVARLLRQHLEREPQRKKKGGR